MRSVILTLARGAALVVLLLAVMLLFIRRQAPGRGNWPQPLDLALALSGVAIAISFLWF
jgi:hypothetical protein